MTTTTPRTNPLAKPWRAWSLLAAALLLLGAVLAFDQHQSRQRIEAEAISRLENHSLVVIEELERRLRSMNAVLERMRDTLPSKIQSSRTPEANAAISRELVTLTRALEGIRTLALFDAQGTMVASNRPELIGQNFVEREYFQSILRQPNVGTLYLSEPFTTVLGAYTITIARMVPDAEGKFAGIATATLDNNSIATLLNSIHAGSETTLSVVHGIGKILTLIPEQKQAPPGLMVNTAGSFFRRHLDSRQPVSLMTGTSAAVGTERIMSMRTLQVAELQMSIPLMIAAARDEAEVLAAWRDQVQLRLLLWLIISGLTIAALWFYQQRQRLFEQRIDQKEGERRGSIQVLQRFIDHLPGTAYVKDADSHTLMANRGFKTLLGMDPAAMIGKTSQELFPGEFGATITIDDQRVLASGRTEVMEESFNGRDYESTKFVIDDGIGHRQLGGMTMDITARKAAERLQAQQLEHLRQLNHQLEEAQNQLLQSEKMASLGQLAAGIAHELNNPIGFVYSNLGTLDNYLQTIFEIAQVCEAVASLSVHPEEFTRIQALKSEKDFDYIKTDIVQLMKESRDGLARVKKIVQDLKNFSHVGEVDWQQADIHAGIDSTLNIVWNELKYKCTVIKHYAPDLPAIFCLPSQLNQVFLNLLVNASHAIETNGEITISTRQPDAEHIEIQFADNGSGIAPEHLAHIFEPFFTTKAVGKGTGLGLSIVWGIIGKHHGKIEVDSTVGRGTRFIITLPLNPPPVTTQAASQ